MKQWIGLLLLIVCVPAGLQAAIDAPDHVIYGNATVFGTPAPAGQVIEARMAASGALLVRHELGRDTRLDGQYALRIPMDAVNPRLPGTARPGDSIEIFIGSTLAARTVVGAIGRAVRLDIDPQGLGTGPSISVPDVEVFEGNSGTTPMVFEATLNTTSDEPVILSWATENRSAIGGAACGPGVDYLSASGDLVFAPGSSAGSITVLVCGNTEIQPTRQLALRFTAVQNGVLTRPEAIGVIIDDDDVPELRLADVTTIKPGPGEIVFARFRPQLSKSSDYPLRFDYRTVPGSAAEGVDFQAVQGTITIEAGDLESEIVVPILHAPGINPPRHFSVALENPFNVSLERESALGIVSDPAFNPALEPVQEIRNAEDGVIGLARPTALVIAPGGQTVYVTSEALDAVVQFHRDELTGQLTFADLHDNAKPALAAAGLDGPMDLQFSPEGEHLYIASRANDAVVVLARDPDSGALSFVQRLVNGSGGVEGLGGVRKLLVSADGAHVYAAGSQDNAVAVFARNPQSGLLQFVQSVKNGQSAGGVTVRGMMRPGGLALSVDGEQLYVASRFGNAVQIFSRIADAGDPEFGRLSFVTALESGLAGITDLEGAFDLQVSPDGGHVYLSAEAADAVVRFDRHADGSLTQASVRRHASPDVPGLKGPQGMALSPGGDRLYVTGFADSTLTVFDRVSDDDDEMLSSGDLVDRQTFFDGQGGIEHMAGPTRVVAADNDGHVYVVASEDNAIVVLRRIPIPSRIDRLFEDRFQGVP